MPSHPHRNPFVYGRILTAKDAACPRPEVEARVNATIRDNARLALNGDRRMGKSSLVGRNLDVQGTPMLRLNYMDVMDLADVVIRTVIELERFLRDRSAVAKKIVPWMREIGVEVKELRLGFAGLEAKTGGIPSDHLKRVFGYIRDVSDRGPMGLFIDELQDICDGLEEKVGNAALALIRDEVQQMSNASVFYAGSARDSFTLLFTSDASPFYNQAPLVTVDSIPPKVMHDFIVRQFGKGHGIKQDAVALIQQIAGDSPDDIQHLCYEAWNEHLTTASAASVETVLRALSKVLKDLKQYGEKWLSDLTKKQQRVVFTVAYFEELGATTHEFLEVADVRNGGSVSSLLVKTLRGRESLLEKVGSRYRFRSRFVRLWFALNYTRAQAVIPALRNEETYRAYLQRVVQGPLMDSLRLQG